MPGTHFCQYYISKFLNAADLLVEWSGLTVDLQLPCLKYQVFQSVEILVAAFKAARLSPLRSSSSHRCSVNSCPQTVWLDFSWVKSNPLLSQTMLSCLFNQMCVTLVCFETLETLSLSLHKELCLTSMKHFEKGTQHLTKRPSLLFLPVHQLLSLSHPTKPSWFSEPGGCTPVWEGSHSRLCLVVGKQCLPKKNTIFDNVSI